MCNLNRNKHLTQKGQAKYIAFKIFAQLGNYYKLEVFSVYITSSNLILVTHKNIETRNTKRKIEGDQQTMALVIKVSDR